MMPVDCETLLNALRQVIDPEPTEFASMMERFARIGAADHAGVAVAGAPVAIASTDSDADGSFGSFGSFGFFGFFETIVETETKQGYGLFEPIERLR